MSESNNVKFVEANGKWLWKRYDEQGSVIFKSPEFDTERQAREDYEVNGGEAHTAPSAPTADVSESQPTDAGNVAPEGEVSAGTATPGAETTEPSQDAGVVA
jgi:hypothetical protein